MKKIIFILLLVGFIFSPALTLYAVGLQDMVIEGWSFEKFEHAKKVYAIEADRATFANKRVGFFDVALCKIALLENARLVLYQNGSVIKTQKFEQAVYEINNKCLLDEKGNIVFSEQLYNK